MSQIDNGRGLTLTRREAARLGHDKSRRRPGHQAEAKQTWGDAADWKISAERTAKMTRADWEQSKAEMARVEDAFVDANALAHGIDPQSAVWE